VNAHHDGMTLPNWRAGAAILLVAIVAIVATGCDKPTDDRDIQWVTVREAETLTQQKGFAISRAKSMVYVDPRSPKDYAAGHIPGAILVPFSDLREGAAAPLAGFDTLVVYDTDYDDVVARALSKRLIEIDQWDVYTLTGGLRAWEKAGNEVAYGLPDKPASGDEDAVAQEAIPKPKFGQSKAK